MSQPRSGQSYGKWLLVDRLGGGGNADVWRARNDAGNEVAIKILRQKNPSSEPFRRFRQEVATVQRLTEERFAGVLPILDAHLPGATGLSGRAWFATPVATPISEALGPAAKVEDVVAAVMAVADTLARLAERDLAHRDIKPENIYQFDDQWVVGDFGLVKVPGSALTADAAKLGPQYYIAPEMLNNPSRAQGPPADVYSLAKTLWVLASGQRFPPPGQHDVMTPATTISAYVNHPRAVVLDIVLQEATAFEPSKRPTASTIKSDLSEWLRSGATTPGQVDLTLIKQRLKIATSYLGKIQDREDREPGAVRTAQLPFVGLFE